MQVDDDGAGFDPEKAEREGRAMGLFTMRERIALLGGVFSIASAPHKGTSIHVNIPVDITPDAAPVGMPNQLENLNAR